MGQQVEISAVPNQSFTVQLDGDYYDIELNTTDEILACSIARNNITLITGCRVVNGTPLIPYSELATGNFIFVITDEELPDYTKFNTTQVLYFLSADELAAL
jgi:hypothetical protein